MDKTSRIKSALLFISPDCERDIWVKHGMAIHSELGPEGFYVFDEWSQGANNYSKNDSTDTWKSFKSGGGVTVASLFKSAIANGWKDTESQPTISDEKLAEQQKLAKEKQANEERDRQAKRAEAAKKAQALWRLSTPAKADHPYLLRKGVSPVNTLKETTAKIAKAALGYAPQSEGKPLTGRLIVVPIKAMGQLSTLEMIDESGRKTALAGGAKSGGYWSSKPIKKGVDKPIAILIAEGVATTLSAMEATGYVAIAALSVSNLSKVASEIKAAYPTARIVILADLDKKTGLPHPNAEKSAKLINGTLAFPDFGSDRHENQTDFNDLHLAYGLSAVSKSIHESLKNSIAEDVAPEGGIISRTKSKNGNESDEVSYCNYQNGRFEVDNSGVRFTEKKDGEWKNGSLVCSRLDIVAMTRDNKGGEWGRLLEWRDSDGSLHQWAMPLELIQGDGTDVRRELARQGLQIEPSKIARDRLTAYIHVWPVDRRARCVDKLGWNESAYVTPNGTIGEGSEPVVFQNSSAIETAISVSGSLDEWRTSVCAWAKGNTRLIFAISAAFAGSLADITKEDSGGFHLIGSSSSGKSSTLKVAGSVWGPPNTYVRSWRSTANALEGLAALHNDGTLILDELSQIDPKEAGQASYLLSNGAGKSRSTRSGSARQAAKWRLIFLSAGEESIASLMARVGIKANAGQEIRLADIDADAGAGMGAFESLHHFESPASMAVSIKDAANRFHGSAGVTWLENLVKDRPRLENTLSENIKKFVKTYAPQGTSGQVERVARRFGLVAAGGELATLYGITGWEQGTATAAASKCLASWVELFGGAGNKEERSIVDQVTRFLSLHGSARFETMDDHRSNDPRTINRVGFYEKNNDGQRNYFVFPSLLTSEICPGYQSKTVKKSLLEAGILIPSKNGALLQKKRLPDMGARDVFVLQYSDVD